MLSFAFGDAMILNTDYGCLLIGSSSIGISWLLHCQIFLIVWVNQRQAILQAVQLQLEGRGSRLLVVETSREDFKYFKSFTEVVFQLKNIHILRQTILQLLADPLHQRLDGLSDLINLSMQSGSSIPDLCLGMAEVLVPHLQEQHGLGSTMFGNLPRAFDEAEIDESLLLRLCQNEGRSNVVGHFLAALQPLQDILNELKTSFMVRAHALNFSLVR